MANKFFSFLVDMTLRAGEYPSYSHNGGGGLSGNTASVRCTNGGELLSTIKNFTAAYLCLESDNDCSCERTGSVVHSQATRKEDPNHISY